VGLVVVAIVITVVPHVFHGATIAFLEALAERMPRVAFDRRMLVHLVVVRIGVTTVLKVVACGFNSFVESATLCIVAVIVGWTIPIAILVLILGEAGGGGLCFRCVGLECGRCTDAES
jgi:hypothetical protein